MKKVIIVGSGAHGREVAGILRHQQREGEASEAFGFIDDDPELLGQTIEGLPVLGDWTWFQKAENSHIAIVCASGFSEVRSQMAQRARALGLAFANAISPAAYISPNARLGEGLVIYPNSTVCTGSSIGDHVIINAGAVVSHDVELGDYSTLNPGVNLAGNAIVGEGCYLGIGSSVIQGIRIGPWTTVGAGAAVVRNLPANVTAVGVPARVIKTHDKEK